MSLTTIPPARESERDASSDLEAPVYAANLPWNGFAQLAQRVIPVPKAVLSLPRGDRHHFAAHIGVEHDGTPRPDALFESALQATGPLVIEDTSLDARARTHAFVTSEGVRACMLQALRGEDGVARGTLGVLDTQPRVWTERERGLLEELARVTAAVLRMVEEPQGGHASGPRPTDTADGMIWEVSFDLLCAIGPDQHLERVNGAWTRLLDWREDELVGRAFASFVHPDDRVTLRGGEALAAHADEAVRSLRLIGRDGRYRVVAWRQSHDHATGRVHAAAHELDGEQALRAQLLQARATAETASRTKERFLTSLSHEFRTPLNAVLGFASVLLESPPGLSPRQRMFLESVQANARELLFTLNDMLDYASLEAPSETRRAEPVALPAMLVGVIERFQRAAQQKGIRLVADWPPQVEPLHTDAVRLRQVLLNLVGNAVRFTEKGRVIVRLVTDASHHPVRLEVEDTGSGMPYEMLDRLFVAFQHGDASPARYRIGNGVGLTASHSMCEDMGYQMRIRSHAGVGTVVVVDFTANEA